MQIGACTTSNKNAYLQRRCYEARGGLAFDRKPSQSSHAAPIANPSAGSASSHLTELLASPVAFTHVPLPLGSRLGSSTASSRKMYPHPDGCG